MENSLLNGVEAEQEEKTIDQVQEDEYNAEQKEAEEGPTRPEYINEEFWKDGKLQEEDLAKAHKAEQDKALGLRRKLSEKGSVKAPKSVEEYSYDEATNEILPSDSPAATILKEKALESGLSKDQFDSFISKIMPALSENGMLTKAEVDMTDDEKQEQFNTFKDAELSKLGADGPKILQKLANWGDGMVNKGVISPDEKPVFESMITDAPSMVLLTKLMSLTGESSIPVQTAVAGGLPSRAEIDQIIASPEYDAGNADAHKKVKAYFEATS